MSESSILLLCYDVDFCLSEFDAKESCSGELMIRFYFLVVHWILTGVLFMDVFGQSDCNEKAKTSKTDFTQHCDSRLVAGAGQLRDLTANEGPFYTKKVAVMARLYPIIIQGRRSPVVGGQGFTSGSNLSCVQMRQRDRR